jgi:LPXTG-motif cell wall-anchored protein
MKTRSIALAALAASGALLLSSATLAGATDAPQVISNFDTDAIGSTSPAGWTVMNQTIDLGVTQIAGCTTVDTSDYNTLRDIANQGPAGYDPNILKDTPVIWEDEPTYSVSVVDGALIEDFEDDDTTYDLTRDSRVLEMSSDMNGGEAQEGYVSHGPAVYSATFTSDFGRQLSFFWAASGAEDDYHVFGYLLNVDTCEQIEIVDATGLARVWQESIVNVPEEGTYRFVFVGGTYDQSWGGAAGGLLWIDSVVEAESTLPLTGASTSMVFLTLLGVAFVASGTLATRRAVRRG